MDTHFGFKELLVWQKAMEFINLVLNEIEQIDTGRKHFRLTEQIESSVTSIAANIAEGKGRNSTKEFIHFLYISRGSLYETITLLNIFKEKDWITAESLQNLEAKGFEIASMLKGLINSLYKKSNNL